jgi:hypothetical protein
MARRLQFAAVALSVLRICAAASAAEPAGNDPAIEKRHQSANNLREIGVAFVNYEDQRRLLPPRAIFDPEGKPLLSWRVLILPYVEQEELYKQFRLDEAWDSENNKKLIEKMPAVYVDPQIKCAPGTTVYQAVVGRGLAFEGNKSLKLANFTDGMSRTIGVVEVDAKNAVPWTKPADWEANITDPFMGLADVQPEGAFQAVYFDAHVETISRKTKPDVIKSLLTRNAGERIDYDSIIEAQEPPPSPRGQAKRPPPTLQELQAARASARRALSLNNLHQLSLAMLGFEAAHGSLPPGAIRDKDGKPLLSWRVAILPFLDQTALYNQFGLDEPWDSDNNKKLLEKMPAVYQDLQFDLKPSLTVYQGVAGPGSPFEGKEGLRRRDIRNFQVITIVQTAPEKAVPWTKPSDWETDPKDPASGLAKVDPGGIFGAALLDGSVHELSHDSNPSELKAMLSITTRTGPDFRAIVAPLSEELEKRRSSRDGEQTPK